MMRIIFMGTPDVSVTCLNRLVESPHEVCLVVTQPDRPKGRGRKPASPPVKITAQKAGIPVVQPENLKSESFHHTIRETRADLMVVVAFSILPASLFPLTTYGAVNLHASLLPKYRGAAPVQWAIAKGETSTGVTVFRLDAKMDHGQILGQRELEIKPLETAGELLPRLVEVGKDLLIEVMESLESGNTREIEQNHSLATPARKLKKDDGRIHWTHPAAEIQNRIRGFNPYPVCFTQYRWSRGDWKTLRVFLGKALISESFPELKPSELILDTDRFPIIGCGSSVLKLLEVQPEGKSRMQANAFINGIPDPDTLEFC